MALRVIRLRHLIKDITVLSSSENELAISRVSIENRIFSHIQEKESLNQQLQHGLINAEVWGMKTDILENYITEDENLVNDIQTKIWHKEQERSNLESELERYSQEEIDRITNRLGLFQ